MLCIQTRHLSGGEKSNNPDFPSLQLWHLIQIFQAFHGICSTYALYIFILTWQQCPFWLSTTLGAIWAAVYSTIWYRADVKRPVRPGHAPVRTLQLEKPTWVLVVSWITAFLKWSLESPLPMSVLRAAPAWPGSEDNPPHPPPTAALRSRCVHGCSETHH